MNRTRRQQAVVSAALSIFAATASADTFEWTNPVDGTWGEAAKWLRLSGIGSAPPGVGDTAIVNEDGPSSDAYSIGLTSNVTIDALTATASYANLGSAPGQPRRTLNVTSGVADFTVNNADTYFWIGADDNDAGLNVNVGDATTVNNGAYLYLGQSQFSTERLLLGTTGGTPGNPSTLLVSSSAVLGVNTTAATAIGTAGNGKLEVRGTAIFSGELRVGKSSVADQGGAVTIIGGALSAPTLSIGGGAAAGSVGGVSVSGGGELLLTTALTVGGAAGTGTGFLELTGARLLSPQTTTTINRTGTMIVRSAQDTYFRSDLNVNGGTLAFDGTNQDVTFAPGVDITVKPEGLLRIGSNLTLPAAANVVQAGGRYHHSEDTVTIPSAGTLTIEGTGTFHSATVVRGSLNFNPSSFANWTDTSFAVLDGGQFEAQKQWTPPTGGTLSVSGGGATYRDLTAGTFAFGTAAGWSSTDRAVVRAETGGTFQKDSGAIEIGYKGTLDVAGGTIIADDIVKHADGQFNFTAGHVLIDNPLPIGSWSPMPGDLNLGSGKKLQTLSTATIEDGRLLQLTGGELRAHSIVNSGTMQLDAGTLALTGGTYTGPAVTVGANAALAGAGGVNARVTGTAGSRIVAEGDLALGDATSAAGFVTAGDLSTGPNTVTLRDSNAAVLGALTQIGSAGAAGTLAAANGIVLNTGASMTGHGTVNTPNDPAKAFVADGAVAGENPLHNLALAGYVKGNGTFNDVTFDGTFDPGHNGPVKVTAGDLRFSGSSTLKLDLGGATAGSGFDQIDALGFGVQLDGTLALNTINNYQPAMLVPHQIIAADAVSGRFDAITGVMVNSALALAVTYEEEAVVVTAALPGDANLDGTVNLADFNALAANFGAGAGAVWATGDFTGDGIVNLSDFNGLAANFGMGAAGTAVMPQDWATLSAAVPEPASVGGLGIAMSASMLRPRRRRA